MLNPCFFDKSYYNFKNLEKVCPYNYKKIDKNKNFKFKITNIKTGYNFKMCFKLINKIFDEQILCSDNSKCLFYEFDFESANFPTNYQFIVFKFCFI